MMKSPNGNNFRVTGHLYGEFIVHRWNPRTEASDAEHWWFLWSVPEYAVGEAGDLRRLHVHYGVTVLVYNFFSGARDEYMSIVV